jgi:hypothetical protein
MQCPSLHGRDHIVVCLHIMSGAAWVFIYRAVWQCRVKDRTSNGAVVSQRLYEYVWRSRIRNFEACFRNERGQMFCENSNRFVSKMHRDAQLTARLRGWNCCSVQFRSWRLFALSLNNILGNVLWHCHRSLNLSYSNTKNLIFYIYFPSLYSSKSF